MWITTIISIILFVIAAVVSTKDLPLWKILLFIPLPTLAILMCIGFDFYYGEYIKNNKPVQYEPITYTVYKKK